MRLLERDDTGIRLTEDLPNDATPEIPPYAILSHTWGYEEVLFQDLADGTAKKKAGYAKIQFCGDQAERNGLKFFWVDTCCIDKSDSAELQGALNSMFQWYRDAAKCFVYLADVSTCQQDISDGFSWELAFRQSRWFSRGWTLQELIAPTVVEFFSREGEHLGDKTSLEQQIHGITRIPLKALQGDPLSNFSVAERMAWITKRNTTCKEDKAYSLFGIFNVCIPILYGEGEDRAFKRLRDKIHEDLRDPRYEKGRIELAKGGLLADACRWVFDNPDFKQWRHSPESRPIMDSISVSDIVAMIATLHNVMGLSNQQPSTYFASLKGGVQSLQRSLENLQMVLDWMAVEEPRSPSGSGGDSQPRTIAATQALAAIGFSLQPPQISESLCACKTVLEELTDILATHRGNGETEEATPSRWRMLAHFQDLETRIRVEDYRLRKCLQKLESRFPSSPDVNTIVDPPGSDCPSNERTWPSSRMGEVIYTEKRAGKKGPTIPSLSMAVTSRNSLSRAPLLLAAAGACFVGAWSPNGTLSTENLKLFLDIHPVLDSTTNSPATLMAAIATTSLSLTAHHYNLAQQGRQQDLLVLGVIGSGIIVALLLGLEGTTVLLRVAPWLAILAFLLCEVSFRERYTRVSTIPRGRSGSWAANGGLDMCSSKINEKRLEDA